MKFKYEKYTIIIVIVIALIITYNYLSYILVNPCHTICFYGGDAAKNNFSYLYHVLYEKGFWSLGMNYPYGEHVSYIDGQPLLSIPLSYIPNITPKFALATMWILIALSYTVSIVFVYLILKYFKTNSFNAILFAVLITLFCPQFFRLTDHFGMSYVCIIPILFYITLLYYRDKKFIYIFYLSLLGVFSAFLHPYFSAIIFVWISAYVLGFIFFRRVSIIEKIKHIYPLAICVLTIFLIIGIVMKLTDPLRDRPIVPYGFLAYRSSFDQIFISKFSPIWQYVNSKYHILTNTDLSYGTEGYGYIGIVAEVAIITSFVANIFIYLNKRKNTNSVFKAQFLVIWIFVGVFSLLLSIGIPFIWHFTLIEKNLLFFRQFRTLGRFIWIFYYVSTVYSALVISRFFDMLFRGKRKLAAYILLSSVSIIWLFELKGYYNREKEIFSIEQNRFNIVFGNGEQNWTKFLKKNDLSPETFQAVLFLKLFIVGSEKLWLGGDHCSDGFSTASEIAMQLHLPCIDAYMARSSWSIAEKQAKLAAGPFVHKPILDDLPNEKPFLLLNDEKDNLDPDQKYILTASDFIGKYLYWNVYKCYPNRIKINDKKCKDSIAEIIPFLPTGDTCISGQSSFFINHFDSGKSREIFFGNGASTPFKSYDTIIQFIEINPKSDDSEFEFSCWFLVNKSNCLSPNFILYFLDADNKEIASRDVHTAESTDNLGLWFRCYTFFKLPKGCKRIKCRMLAEDESYQGMDELMLRPVGKNIITKTKEGSIMVNNHNFLR